jgi:hypothetical protein
MQEDDMNWFWVSVGAVGGMLFLLARGRRAQKRAGASHAQPAKSEVTEQSRVETALASGDIDQMEAMLTEVSESVHRHVLLEQIVSHYYRHRSESKSRDAFYRYAKIHIQEASGVLDAFSQTEYGRPDRIDTFKMMAIAMDQDGRYDEAIDICRQALSMGLENGTKTGFEGRISRLERKRDA